MFTDMDLLLANQRREELAREIASGRLGRKLRAARRPFRPPRSIRVHAARPAGGG